MGRLARRCKRSTAHQWAATHQWTEALTGEGGEACVRMPQSSRAQPSDNAAIAPRGSHPTMPQLSPAAVIRQCRNRPSRQPSDNAAIASRGSHPTMPQSPLVAAIRQCRKRPSRQSSAAVATATRLLQHLLGVGNEISTCKGPGGMVARKAARASRRR